MMLTETDVSTPSTLKDALKMLASGDSQVKIVAGGTDMIIQLKDGLRQAGHLINVYDLDELRFIRLINGRLCIGALARYSDIIHSPLTIKHASILVESAKTIGGVQMQNRGTIGGNLCNASPAGDSIPPLVALDAVVKLESINSSRELPISSFMLGPRKTVLAPNELVSEIHFEPMGKYDRGVFLKLGLRASNAISVVSVAI